MWSRVCVARRLLRMSKQTATAGGVPPTLSPGLYLHVATASTQQANETFDLTKNPVYQKYAEKLEDLKKSDPHLYDERMENLRKLYSPLEEQPITSNAEHTESSDTLEGSSVDPAPLSEDIENNIVDRLHRQQTKPKRLSSIMKVDLLSDKTTEEIKEIWTGYHSKHGKSPCVFAIIHADDYAEMSKRLDDFPLFLYPVPRGEGYEFFIQQMCQNSIHFTTLGGYQTHKENSPNCLTLDHYTELQHNKGIVLMKGEPDTNILSVHEAQLLAMQVKIYYGVHSGLKFNLVRQFNNDPTNFKYLDLIQEFEKYKKDSKEYLMEFQQK